MRIVAVAFMRPSGFDKSNRYSIKQQARRGKEGAKQLGLFYTCSLPFHKCGEGKIEGEVGGFFDQNRS